MPRLVLYQGREDEKVFPLHEGSNTIGRAETSDVFVLHKSLSRQVVSDENAPHDATARITAEVITHGIWPMKTYETKGRLALERSGTIVDQVEGSSSNDKACTGFENSIAAEFTNALMQSERVAQLAKADRKGPSGPTVAPGSGPASPAGGAAPEGFVAGTSQPTTWALVVGSEKYRDVPSPTGARHDAEQFARMLRETAGLREENLRLILDDRATRSDIDKELSWLEKNVPEGGRVMFYFSGHGAPDAAPTRLPARPTCCPTTATRSSWIARRCSCRRWSTRWEGPRRARRWCSSTRAFRARGAAPCCRRERGRWCG